MRGETIYVVTDQGPATGIGTYAEALARLLRGTFPNLTLLSLCYLPGQELLGWRRLPQSKVARSWHDIPMVIRHNYLQLCKSIPRESPIHFCGVSYASVINYTRSVVTVHDYYPRLPALVNLRNPRVLLRDVSALKHFIELPHQVRTARARIVPTQYVQKCLYHGCSLSSTTIHHWIDPSNFHPRGKQHARETLGLPLEGKLVLNVSTGSSNKNYALLANVSSSLRKGYRLVIGGGQGAPGVVEGILLPRLSNDAYPLLFNACDVYLHTSTQEGFGWPLIQAMASGLPIVALRTEVAMEVLGDAALFVEPTDSIDRVVLTIEDAASEPLHSEIIAREEVRSSLFGQDIAREAYKVAYEVAFGL